MCRVAKRTSRVSLFTCNTSVVEGELTRLFSRNRTTTKNGLRHDSVFLAAQPHKNASSARRSVRPTTVAEGDVVIKMHQRRLWCFFVAACPSASRFPTPLAHSLVSNIRCCVPETHHRRRRQGGLEETPETPLPLMFFYCPACLSASRFPTPLAHSLVSYIGVASQRRTIVAEGNVGWKTHQRHLCCFSLSCLVFCIAVPYAVGPRCLLLWAL